MRLLCLSIVILAFGLGGCFSTREPAAPAGPSDWTPPNQPEILLANFNAAVTSLNVANYERCFVAEGYAFSPDPTVARNNQGLFASWTLQTSELEYIRNLVRVRDPVETNRLTLSGQRTNNFSADSVEVLAGYTLHMAHKDTLYRVYDFAGQIVLSMSRNTFNEWKIGRWRDVKTGQQPCWSELKERFAAR